jgi:hypothetical protein
MCDPNLRDCCAKDSDVFRFDHPIITLHSYPGPMSRSSAWQTLRSRKRRTRPANASVAHMHHRPRVATTLPFEPGRTAWTNESKLEEWKTLEFRHLRPPTGEDWNR